MKTLLEKQQEEELGMTRAELLVFLELIAEAVKCENMTRVHDVLRDQFYAICEQENIKEKAALNLLFGPWMLNALARAHFYRSGREVLQGFYNWLRNEENEADLLRYRHRKY